MKSLVEYINENLHINEALILFKPSAKTAKNAADIEDAMKGFLQNTNKRYSFENKSDLDQLFKDFCNFAKKHYAIDNKVLKEFNVIEGKSIAKLITSNKEELEKAGWKFDAIKSFDETEQQKKYKAWKNSDDYVEGKKFVKRELKDADEEELERTLVVYDVNDPANNETTIEYDFYGKVGKDTSHQINMIKVDWKYSTGLKYYDARPILLSNYCKKVYVCTLFDKFFGEKIYEELLLDKSKAEKTDNVFEVEKKLMKILNMNL